MKCNLFNEYDNIVEEMGKVTGPKDCSVFGFDNSTVPSDRVDPATIGLVTAAVNVGGKILEKAGEATIVQMGGNKVKIGPGNCWRDGSGWCPNGNCLDNKGRRGEQVRVEIFTCPGKCFFRPQCRYETCCEIIN